MKQFEIIETIVRKKLAMDCDELRQLLVEHFKLPFNSEVEWVVRHEYFEGLEITHTVKDLVQKDIPV